MTISRCVTRAHVALITLAAICWACGDDRVNAPLPVLPLYYLKAPTNSGDGQSDTVLATLALPFRVLVRRGDAPARDVTVLWEISADTLLGVPDVRGTTVTDAAGIATSPFRLTLGRVAGPYMVRASVPGVIQPGPIFLFSDAPCGSGLCFAATANPGKPRQLHYVSGNDQIDTVATPLEADYVVQATDAYGNGVAGVAIDWAVTAGGGSIAPSRDTLTTAPAGYARARSTLGSAGGTQTVTVTASRLPGAPRVTFTATGLTLLPVASLTLTPESATVAVDRTVQLSAVLRDSTGAGVFGRRRIGWTSTAQAVATVDTNGLVRATGPGSTAVIAISEGVGDTAFITVPVPPPPFVLAAMAPGNLHTCGLTGDGTAYCWGENGVGQLGNGSYTRSSTPVAVSGGHRFASLVAGLDHTCGLTSAGTAYCWGGNSYGELGNGSFTNSPIPVAVAGGLTFSTLGTGAYHSCGLTSSGAGYCWGWGDWGQLGNGSFFTSSAVPVAVLGGQRFTALAVGLGWHTCALASTGAAYCWGHNFSGELGNGSFDDSSTPVPVSGSLTFSTLVTGVFHTCGLTQSGAGYCWGDNHWGELGDGSPTGERPAPGIIAGASSLTALTGGGGYSCGLWASGGAYCWGANGSGQLGDGSTTDAVTPVPVAGGLQFTALFGGYSHACAITMSGAAYCWGDNSSGQLGDGTTINSSFPIRVAQP